MAAELTTEQQWIEIIKDLTAEELIGDDCAILPDGSLVTADMLIEGNHFLLTKIALADLGWKSLAVNLSDVAAMAGTPQFATVSLGLPPQFSQVELRQLYAGMVDCAKEFQTRIVGGDLTRSERLVISISLIGVTGTTGAMLRKGATAGDAVVVTGDFGASAAGLWLILTDSGEFSHCLKQHVRPTPRIKEAQSLARLTGGRGALMDASDGLADALIQIARHSKVGMKIESNHIPIHDQTRQVALLSSQTAVDLALYGGEDYELVATAPQALLGELERLGFRAIGHVTEGEEVFLCREGKTIERIAAEKTFQHWQGC